MRWLSSGQVQNQSSSCFNEIKTFLNDKDLHYAELFEDLWLQNFYFMVDMTAHLNKLNIKLQGQGNIAFSLLEEVISFEQKLTLFHMNLQRKNLIHFN